MDNEAIQSKNILNLEKRQGERDRSPSPARMKGRKKGSPCVGWDGFRLRNDETLGVQIEAVKWLLDKVNEKSDWLDVGWGLPYSRGKIS